MPPSPSVRIIDYDGDFRNGVKSDSDPSQIPQGYFWMGMNVINLGGVISCRPGHRCVRTLPDGNLQGGFIFLPLVGLAQCITVIDGFVYVADWPFTSFRRLPGVSLLPSARLVYWAQTTQSAERLGTGVAPAIRAINPRTVLMIQDGGFSAPVWWDGADFGQVSGDQYETPTGGPMAWVGDRLWVGRGRQLFASDISNPFSFREQVYLGGQSSFFFRSEVTAMCVTPSTESPQLMVFTDVSGSIVQANIRDRTLWTSTLNFQEEVVGTGTTSPRSVLSHYGHLVWYSTDGVAIYDPALSGKITTRLPIRDNELLYSKTQMSEDLTGVAAGSFGQWLAMSVPAEDTYNKHTWVLNHASIETLNDDSGPSWSGYWTGTRPVEWMYGNIMGAKRIFHISVDADGKNRLWESFTTDRLDNGCPITWAIWTRGYFGASSVDTSQKAPGTRCRLAWTDLGFAGIAEDLNVGVFYAGGTRGHFRQVMSKLVKVEKGSLAFDQPLTSTSTVLTFKPQSRTLRTEDANQQVSNDVDGSCGVESSDEDNIDRAFQLLVVGHGPATLRWVRPFAFLVPEDLSGDAAACDDEAGVNAVSADGAGIETDNYADAVASLAIAALNYYTSNRTVVVDQDGFRAVGVGAAESIVSQEAADRVADIIATKQAENELTQTLPPILSTGLE